MAGGKVFSRGLDYFVKGYVREIVKTEKDVRAKVMGRGGTLYSVHMDKSTISAEDIVDLCLKAADYGVDDSLEPILRVLPEETLLRAEELARERVGKVKNTAESWQLTDERFLLVTILALLGKREEYMKPCKEWGEEEWMAELREFEK